jgi:WD40 repeat protein
MKMKKLVNVLLALAFGGTMPVFAAHELLYAVTLDNDLVSFYTDAPGSITGAHAITGLQPSEEIRGIDSWNGTLYGIGSSSRLYIINPGTGAATLVGSGQFSPLLNGQSFGVDNGPSGMVVVSDLRENLLVDRTTGVATALPALHYAAGDPNLVVNPAVTGLAYDSASGKWYAADSLANIVATFNPTTGVLSTIGAMGIDVSTQNGLDISPATGIMYLASPAASSDPAANLYTVNKTTGAVTLVGLIGQPTDNILVRGLAVAP